MVLNWATNLQDILAINTIVIIITVKFYSRKHMWAIRDIVYITVYMYIVQ